ncbi:hypothetical protein TCE0_034r12015 [Talaromyces pinophilus]|uniref:Heterokaryon incompatibility domain-containing protein n=1 Tax=Talaromyces pinophilus TaxID=128442 RepID=A0A6V8HIH8_TALPI|nr:hypothetical protein TCE0_034r12015 [Talaromyces pinophilus]
MEHLPHPSGANPIKVPYVCTEAYDYGPFEEYPRRKGWKTDSDGQPIFHDQEAFDDSSLDEDDIADESDELDSDASEKESSTEEEEDSEVDEGGDDDYDEDDILETIDPFVQTWLFFGLLIEVFGIVGIEICESDFICDSDKITTAKLPALIEEWRSKEARGDDESEEVSSPLAKFYAQRAPTWQADRRTSIGRYGLIRAVLVQVQSYVNKHCHSGELGSYGPNVPCWAVQDEISLSIMVLGWTLQSAAYSIYEPGRVRSVEPWGSNNILTNNLLNDSRRCMGEAAKLMADLEIDGLYYVGGLSCPRREQDHESCTEMGCSGQGIKGKPYQTQHVRPDCTCSFAGVSIPDLIAVISKGEIPLVSWTPDAGLNLVAYNPQFKQKYVAISHIWSDGMGNENDNALPECQLSRIQALVDELDSTARPDQPQNRVFGPKVLSESGSPVDRSVGFWMDTLCILSDERSKEKPGYRDIRDSSISNMRNIYKGAHRVLVLDKWIQEVNRSADVIEKVSRLYLSNWQHRLWTLQEGVLAQNLFFQFKDGQLELDDLWREEAQYKENVPGVYSGIVRTMLPLIPISNPILKDGEEGENLAWKFTRLLGGMANRKTSKTKDEPVCIATILGESPEPILQFRTGDERMQCLLRMIGSFPRELVFNELPRLPFEGFRWAPRSFIGQSKSIWARNEGLSENRKSDKLSTYGKLRHHKRGGYLMQFPGIILRQGSAAPERIFAVESTTDQSIWYGVFLAPDDRDDYPGWNSTQTHAIVLSGEVPNDGQEVAAIFGIVRQRDEGVRILQHLCGARLKRLNTSPRGKTPDVLRTLSVYGDFFHGDADLYDCSIAGEWIEGDDEWCIV